MTLRLGPFLLGSELGAGGMGRVWAAIHEPTGRPVAVKCMTGDVARQRRYQQAFQAEVRAVAALDHPHVIHVLDHGQIGDGLEEESDGALVAGSPYLVMERASGGTLGTWAGTGRSWHDVREVLLALLDALAHAHSRGVVHRDLKPGNVLFSGPQDLRPGLKLSDFGIAYTTAASTAAPAGTLRYAAPEQLAGVPSAQGPWTDLYALGVCAWELLAGQSPWLDEQPAVLVRRKASAAPTGFVPRCAVPQGAEEWLIHLLQPDPVDRPHHAVGARRALFTLGDVGEEEPGSAFAEPVRAAAMTGWQDAATLEEALTLDLPGAPGPAHATDTASRRCTLEIPTQWADTVDRLPELTGMGLGLFGVRAVPLVGRTDEQALLWEALIEAHEAGEPRVVVLEGSPGLGKSRLARWICERAHELAGADSLRADHDAAGNSQDSLRRMVLRFLRCQDDEGGVRDAIARHLAITGTDDVDAAQDLHRWLVSGRATSGEQQQQLARLLERVTAHGHPVVLWLDDVQWGLEALALIRRLLDPSAVPCPPVLVVLTVLSDARADDPLADQALRALEREEGVRWRPLEPIEVSRRIDQVSEMLGLSPEVARAVAERTEGVPLFAEQLVGDWVERGVLVASPGGLVPRPGTVTGLPDALHDLWATRLREALEGEPAASATGLELAATLGTEVSQDEWQAACAEAGIDCPQHLVDRLADLGLVQIRERRSRDWRFAHGLCAESLRRVAREGGRLRDHHRVCAAMLRLRRPDAHGRLAWHLLAAGDTEAALQPLKDGISEAIDRGRYAEADRLLHMGSHGGSAVASVEDGGLALLRGQLRMVQGRFEEAIRVLQPLRARAQQEGWSRLAARSDVFLGFCLGMQGHLEEGCQRLADAVAAAAGRHPRVAALAHLYLGWLSRAAGREELAVEHGREARCAFDQLGLVDLSLEAASPMVEGLLGLGRFDEAAAIARDTAQVAQEHGNLVAAASAELWLGDIAQERGQLAEAARSFHHARDLYLRAGAPDADTAQVNLALIQALRGELREARREALGLVPRLHAEKLRQLEGMARLVALYCGVALGEFGGWPEEFGQVCEAFRSCSYHDPEMGAFWELTARAAETGGRHAEAAAAWERATEEWAALDRVERRAQAVEGLQAARERARRAELRSREA